MIENKNQALEETNAKIADWANSLILLSFGAGFWNQIAWIGMALSFGVERIASGRSGKTESVRGKYRRMLREDASSLGKRR